MNLQFYRLLVDPGDQSTLTLYAAQENIEAIHDGYFLNRNQIKYPIHNGIPRFVISDDIGQLQTSDSFGFKWKKRDTYDSPTAKATAAQWYLQKYGFDSIENWTAFYNSKQCVLDIGCGSGFSASIWLDSPKWHRNTMYVGADISEAVDVAYERLGHLPNTHFVQADALQLPFANGTFDAVFSEGVLHHTPSTRAALLSAARVLTSGGKFHFYVYRRKGPVREFADDYIRHKISGLSNDESWDAMRSLTELGRALAELNVSVSLPDVPLLEIRSGRYDVQRLIYYHFTKLFWNSDLSFEENVHVNFDWYRPTYAHRQSAEDIRHWCEEGNLSIERLYEDESGITVCAKRI
ncbi:MAG: methyltransferase domain-containing protein [Anaerolineae bacterium]|nr:methyltransferase domain-containing protein [Anaerolineae bacterium]